MSKTTLISHQLSTLQTLIEQEYAEFKDEIITGTGSEVFDRAEEILMKTHLTDEILSGFTDTVEYAGDEATVNSCIKALFELLSDPSCQNLLNTLYEDYMTQMSCVIDKDLISDYLISNYEAIV